MRMYKMMYLLLVLHTCANNSVFAQNSFHGSFTMTLDSGENITDPPFLWNVSYDGEMAHQVQDKMLKKGVNKRVIFKPADSTWTMLLSFNKVKQGTRINSAAMYRDTMK